MYEHPAGRLPFTWTVLLLLSILFAVVGMPAWSEEVPPTNPGTMAFDPTPATPAVPAVEVKEEADRPRIRPTVGRIVLYRFTRKRAGQPDEMVTRPAVIVAVWGDTCVNLRVLTDGSNDGEQPSWITSATIDDNGKDAGTWSWMPYQLGQAAKNDGEVAALRKAVLELTQRLLERDAAPRISGVHVADGALITGTAEGLAVHPDPSIAAIRNALVDLGRRAGHPVSL